MNESHSNRAIQILASLGKAIAYLALFLGSQALVSTGFSIAAALTVISGVIYFKDNLDVLKG